MLHVGVERLLAVPQLSGHSVVSQLWEHFPILSDDKCLLCDMGIGALGGRFDLLGVFFDFGGEELSTVDGDDFPDELLAVLALGFWLLGFLRGLQGFICNLGG